MLISADFFLQRPESGFEANWIFVAPVARFCAF
jgi:hypothetical protein